jgi:hypothetical protein
MRRQLDETPLREILGRLPRAPEHRLRQPEGDPVGWPAGALPPGTRVLA